PKNQPAGIRTHQFLQPIQTHLDCPTQSTAHQVQEFAALNNHFLRHHSQCDERSVAVHSRAECATSLIDYRNQRPGSQPLLPPTRNHLFHVRLVHPWVPSSYPGRCPPANFAERLQNCLLPRSGLNHSLLGVTRAGLGDLRLPLRMICSLPSTRLRRHNSLSTFPLPEWSSSHTPRDSMLVALSSCAVIALA